MPVKTTKRKPVSKEPVRADRYPVLAARLYDVASLAKDPRNARTHDQRNIDSIKGSLTRYGQRKNIVVTETGEVKAGNGTLEAALQLGWTQIVGGPAPRKKNEALGYALADNRTAELASWDRDILGIDLRALSQIAEMGFEGLASIGFDHVDVEQYVRNDIIPGGDAVPDPPKVAKSKLGQLWQLGEHRLACGDCGDPKVWAKLLGDEKLQMVWTDAPYGVNYVGGDHAVYDPKERKRQGGKTIQNDSMTPIALRAFLKKTFGAIAAVSVPGAVWYCASPSGDLFGEFAFVLGREGLGIWKHNLVWVKNSLVMGRSDYHYRHESIFYGWMPGAGHFFVESRTHDTVFEIDRPSRSEEHPTMKPIELVAQHIRNSSKPGWIVGDGFGGSGTTLIACEQEGRKARLVELDPIYVDVIIERWQNATGGKAKLL